VTEYIAGVAHEKIDSVSEAYLRLIAGSNPAAVERLLRALRATPRATVATAGAKSFLQYDPRPALAAYRGPSRAIVTPTNDSPISLHRLHEAIPRDVVTGTRHWIHLEKPDQFNRLLDAVSAVRP
jgi:pimeloyl-ACP methyl ester carboxylesterase